MWLLSRAHNDSEVVREIQVQFERASESGAEVAKMLDVRKFAYKKNSAYQGKETYIHVTFFEIRKLG